MKSRYHRSKVYAKTTKNHSTRMAACAERSPIIARSHRCGVPHAPRTKSEHPPTAAQPREGRRRANRARGRSRERRRHASSSGLSPSAIHAQFRPLSVPWGYIRLCLPIQPKARPLYRRQGSSTRAQKALAMNVDPATATRGYMGGTGSREMYKSNV